MKYIIYKIIIPARKIEEVDLYVIYIKYKNKNIRLVTITKHNVEYNTKHKLHYYIIAYLPASYISYYIHNYFSYPMGWYYYILIITQFVYRV